MFRSKPDVRDEIIRAQQAQIADLLDRLQEMVGQIHLHQVGRAQAETEAAIKSMFVTDDEVEARHLAAQGFISEDELHTRLAEIDKQMEFDSFDPSTMI